jgi:hypothetical protein
MSTRTVRFDEETEKVLQQVLQATGMSTSAALKRGILALRDAMTNHVPHTPYEIYRALDLGPGGYAIAPSTDTRRGVQDALKRKHRR